MKNILAVYGTRPEEIKLYPFQRYGIKFLQVNQSKDLHQNLINPDYKCSENLLGDRLRALNYDLIMVQGDTRTAFRAAVYGYENKKPVIHIEAGLRTFDLTQPFPEEGYRQMIDCISTYKYCSRPDALRNCNGIYAGQTSIDTLHEFCGEIRDDGYVIVTLHRNESMEKIREYITKIKRAAREYELKIFAHPNAIGQKLRKHFNCLDPMNYREFVKLLAKSHGVITDSGGLQEEAISMGKVCVVLRDKQERSNLDIYTTGATARIMKDLNDRLG